MATYSDYQQRLLDQKSGEEMDRSYAKVRFGNLDDFSAYLSDFLSSYFVAMREEEEASQAWEREAVERENHMRRLL